MSVTEVLPIILGIIITIIISLALFPYILKQRANKLFEMHMPLKDSFKISYIYVLVYILIFEIFNITGVIIGGLMHSFGGFIGLIIGIFTMQFLLKKRLIKESLEEERAKKLSGSATSYFFWISLLLGFVYIILIAIIFSYT